MIKYSKILRIKKILKIKKIGKRYWSLCPFHKEKTESFLLNFYKDFYYCFGCKRHGNITKLIEKFEHKINFIKKINFVFDILKKKEAIEYLKYRRLFNSYIISIFNIGFCSNSDIINIKKKNKKYLIKKKFLFNKYFLLNNRIIFPIKNIKGKIVALIGRSIYFNRNKYLYYKIYSNFKKKNILYGFYENIKYIKRFKSVFVVEGCFDLLSLIINNIKNSVSTLGVNVDFHQLSKLSFFCKKIVLVFDNDLAGKIAILKIFKIRKNFNIWVFFLNRKDPNVFFIKKKRINFFFLFKKKTISIEEFYLKKKKKIDFVDETFLSKIKFLKNENYLRNLFFYKYKFFIKKKFIKDLGHFYTKIIKIDYTILYFLYKKYYMIFNLIKIQYLNENFKKK